MHARTETRTARVRPRSIERDFHPLGQNRVERLRAHQVGTKRLQSRTSRQVADGEGADGAGRLRPAVAQGFAELERHVERGRRARPPGDRAIDAERGQRQRARDAHRQGGPGGLQERMLRREAGWR